MKEKMTKNKEVKYGKVREEHKEQIDRWANYVREHPDEWKKKMKPFIDSQIIMARRFYNKLNETNEGREKIKLLKSRVKINA